ncbi:chromate transporter [Streptomyces sp. L7]
MGRVERFLGRLRCRASRARTAIYLRSIPGLDHRPRAQSLGRAALAAVGIFLPGLLLVIAALPYWQALRARPSMAALLAGVNAAVVGLLAFALYTPVWTSAVRSWLDFAVAAIAFLLLTRWKTPPLIVVALCAAAGVAAAMLGWSRAHPASRNPRLRRAGRHSSISRTLTFFPFTVPALSLRSASRAMPRSTAT